MHLLSPRWPGGRSWLTEGAGSVHQRPTITPHPAITCPQAHRIIVSNYFQSARQNGPFNHGLLARPDAIDVIADSYDDLLLTNSQMLNRRESYLCLNSSHFLVSR